jgi:hypothetical protein
MILTLEWRIPWDVPKEREKPAAEKLKKYIDEGTFFESAMRMRVVQCDVVNDASQDQPYLKLTLER